MKCCGKEMSTIENYDLGLKPCALIKLLRSCHTPFSHANLLTPLHLLKQTVQAVLTHFEREACKGPIVFLSPRGSGIVFQNATPKILSDKNWTGLRKLIRAKFPLLERRPFSASLQAP